MPCLELAATATALRSTAPGLAHALASRWLQPTTLLEMWATTPDAFDAHCAAELVGGPHPTARSLTLGIPPDFPVRDADVAARACAEAYRFVADWMAGAGPGEIDEEWDLVDAEWRTVTVNVIRNVAAVVDRQTTDDVMPGFNWLGWNEYAGQLARMCGSRPWRYWGSLRGLTGSPTTSMSSRCCCVALRG